MHKTLEILEKQYGLKESHIRLLRKLLKKEATARKLVRQTGIPVGSIYELLDELEGMKLIKVKKAPYKTYYIDRFEQALADFADEKISEQANAREKLLKSVKESQQRVKAYDDYLKFKLGCISQDPQPKRVYGVITNMQFPRFMLPKERKNYLEYKRLIKKHTGQHYSEAEEKGNTINVKKYEELDEKCRDFKWVINIEEFRMLRRIARKRGELRELMERIKEARKRGAKVKLSRKSREQFILTDKTVQMQVRDSPLFVGLIIEDRDTVSTYKKMFMNIWRNAARELGS